MRQIRAKILSSKELARRSLELRRSGRRLVLTNGCFDLLHVGHVRYLEAARRLGDALAVGVNGDATVRRLKGPGRPLVNAEDRAEVLAALESVDYVTIFQEDTAEALVRQVQPLVYVKGGDYSADPHSPNFPPEASIVTDYGGEVRIIPFVSGYSTTALAQKLHAD